LVRVGSVPRIAHSVCCRWRVCGTWGAREALSKRPCMSSCMWSLRGACAASDRLCPRVACGSAWLGVARRGSAFCSWLCGHQVHLEEDGCVARALDASGPVAGSAWHLVDEAWLSKWRKFVLGEVARRRPLQGAGLPRKAGAAVCDCGSSMFQSGVCVACAPPLLHLASLSLSGVFFLPGGVLSPGAVSSPSCSLV